MTAPSTTQARGSGSWEEVNGQYLQLVEGWARLRMARQVAWIRHRAAALGNAGDERLITDVEVEAILSRPPP